MKCTSLSRKKDIFANRMTDFERRALNFEGRRGEKECNQEHCGAVMDRVAEQVSWADVVGRDHKIIIMKFNWGYLQHLQVSKYLQGIITEKSLKCFPGTKHDGSHDWNVVIQALQEGQAEETRFGGRGGVARYVNDQLECMELCLGMDVDVPRMC